MNRPSTPEGWYPNPENAHELRFWDGAAWTAYTAPAPSASHPAGSYGSVPPPPGGGQFSSIPNYSGSPPASIASGKPDNYLAWAIVTTVACCLPFGIVSIVNANKVDTAWMMGDHQEAYRRSEAAKKWAIASAVTGLVIGLAYILIWVVILGAANSLQ